MVYILKTKIPPLETFFASRCIVPSMHAMVAQYREGSISSKAVGIC